MEGRSSEFPDVNTITDTTANASTNASTNTSTDASVELQDQWNGPYFFS